MTNVWHPTKPAIAIMMMAMAFLAVFVSGNASAAPPACVGPASGAVPTKVLNIFNNSSIPIYVVLEAAKQNLLDAQGQPYDRWLQAQFNPTPGTYASTYVYRAYVNPVTGIAPGNSVQVTVPFYTQLEAAPCPFDVDQYINWWRALRVYIYDDLGAVTNAYGIDTNPQFATPISPPGTIPSCQGCALTLVVYRSQTGGDQHGVSLPPGDPSQLLEFTFALVPEAPQPLAINYDFVDYDISSVDQVYLPVAMDPLDNPYIGYIGSVLARGKGPAHTKDGFGGILHQFQKDFGWPKYQWPDYVTNQDNVRLPGAYNVMNEIAFPGSPQPFNLDAQALKKQPVIKAMGALWDECCGAGWPQSPSVCTIPSGTPPAICPNMATVAHLFEKNYANYQTLCSNPLALTRDYMLAQVYGWVPFNQCPSIIDNQLKNTPGYDKDTYLEAANAYVDLQYSSSTTSPSYGPFNRYVELIHSQKYLHIGEYAFSIDDAAGNMEEVGDGLNITVAGAKGLGNPNPYDPWRYFLFGVGSAPPDRQWTKYRICTRDDPSTCPSTAPDRDFVVSGTDAGTIGYAAIKIGAVPCPCVIVLQDSAGTLYKVVVQHLPAPPPTHPIKQQGDPPTAIDLSWVTKAGTAYANVSCADTETPFQWCSGLIPSTDPGKFPPRTAVYHISTGPPVPIQPGVQFTPGEVVGTLLGDGASVMVTWPSAITQHPSGSPVNYQLTLWDLADCPLQGAACNGHAHVPLAGVCAPTATACKVSFQQVVPPLVAGALKSMSVVAVDQHAPNPTASIQGNFTSSVGGTTGLLGTIEKGTATVGEPESERGHRHGAVTISAAFTFTGALDLAAAGAVVTILDGLNEIGGSGDLVEDRPVTLTTDGKNTSKTARFKNARGETPKVTVTIERRHGGQYTLALDVKETTIGLPSTCPKPELVTSIKVDDGTNPPFILGLDQVWQCVQHGKRIELRKAP